MIITETTTPETLLRRSLAHLRLAEVYRKGGNRQVARNYLRLHFDYRAEARTLAKQAKESKPKRTPCDSCGKRERGIGLSVCDPCAHGIYGRGRS